MDLSADLRLPDLPADGLREPDFTAYKRGFLCIDPANPSRPLFRGYVLSAVYGPIATAVCFNTTYDQAHDVPDPGCNCGFYGLTDRKPIAEMTFSGAGMSALLGSSILLEVSFYGTVIEGSRGFRASHQRVNQVFLDSRCVFCTARAVATAPSRTITSASYEGSPSVRIIDSFCATHLPKDSPAYSPAALASHFGLGVAWGDQISADEVWYRGPTDLYTTQRRSPFAMLRRLGRLLASRA